MQTVRACDLDNAALDDWQRLREAAGGLGSSFHDPHWFVAVSRFWASSRVTLVHDGTALVAALPHDSVDGRTLRPPAYRLADHQGAAVHPAADLDARSVLRHLGAQRYVFDHASDDQPWLASSITSWASSPTIGLGTGFDGYLERRAHAGSGLAAWERRRRSMIERRVGPIRFEPASSERDDLELLVRWKSAQYLRSGHTDLFGDAQVRALIDHLVFGDSQLDTPLSVLRGGDRTLAIQLGPRSATSWHWWLPAYDPAFSSMSAGTVLLLDMARHGADDGLELIDLGKGDEAYKRRLADSELRVGAGVLECHPWRASLRQRAKRVRDAGRRRVQRRSDGATDS